MSSFWSHNPTVKLYHESPSVRRYDQPEVSELPKIVGALCWYDESPAWLAATVSSLAGFVDHLVALDGGYQFFPGAAERPSSKINEAETLMAAAAGAGIGLTLHRPAVPYQDNEVEKRALSLDLAYNIATQDDWIFVIDADEVVRYAAPDLKEKLAGAEEMVATARFYDELDAQAMVDRAGDVPHQQWEPESQQNIRRLYKAVPDLQYVDAHYVLRTRWPDGKAKYLYGHAGTHEPIVPAFDAGDYLQVDHRQKQRHRVRDQRRREWYRRRDAYGLESLFRYEMEGLDGKPVEVRPKPSE